MNQEEIDQIIEDGLYCIGCGARIQYTNKDEAGYLPKSALEKYLASEDQEAELLCNRCFRLRNYNEIQPVDWNSDHFIKILDSIAAKKALILYVVDLFDVSGSLISNLSNFIGDNPVILIGNKLDVLPKSVKPDKIIRWLNGQAKAAGINVVDTILTKATKGNTGEQVVEHIAKYQEYPEVYVVGVTNVGKSTLINQIINYVASEKNVITTSRFPGTTLDKIEIPLSENMKIIDTPGIIHGWQMAHYVDEKNYKFLLPGKELRPQTNQLQTGQTIFIGGLAWIDFLNTDSISITSYFENNLKLHRTKTAKSMELVESQMGDLLKPTPKDPDTIFNVKSLKVKKGEDVVIAGLGWINFHNDTTVNVHAPQGVEVSVRQGEI